MAGFADKDAIINALTVSGYGQLLRFSKTMPSSPTANAIWTLWDSTGFPAAGAYTGSADTAVAPSSSTTGAIPFTNAGTNRNMFALTAEASTITASATGTLTLYDRLLYYPAVDTSDTTHPMTNSAVLTRYTTGRGVVCWVEVTTAISAASATWTFTYTDQDGNTGNTAATTNIASAAARRSALTPHLMPLAAGDSGIRAITDLTLSGSAITGTVAIVLAYPICTIPLPTVGVSVLRDMVAQIALPEIQDGACLSWMYRASAGPTTPTFEGEILICEN